LVQTVTSANILNAIVGGAPTNNGSLPTGDGANGQFAAILSETQQAPTVSNPSQVVDTNGVTLTPAALARFNTLTPGAFHPRTAYQKILTAAEPHAPSQALALIDIPVGIETKPASPALLSLLDVSTMADSESAEEEMVTAEAENAEAPVISATPIAPPQVPAVTAVVAAETEAAAGSGLDIVQARTSVAAFVPSERAERTIESDTATVADIDQGAAKSETDQSASTKQHPQTVAPTVALPQPQHLATASISHSAATATEAPRIPSAPLAQVPHLISVEAGKLDAGGTREFTIRLDPAELGRIDVKLEVKADGYVTAVVQADQASTYDLLRQDARQFEQSLWDSGLKTNSDSLNFSLRRDDQSAFAQLMSGDGQSGRDTSRQGKLSDRDVEDQIARQPANHRLSLSHIDVMA
jgi:flagellar hook-length control protein FliK